MKENITVLGGPLVSPSLKTIWKMYQLPGVEEALPRAWSAWVGDLSQPCRACLEALETPWCFS